MPQHNPGQHQRLASLPARRGNHGIFLANGLVVDLVWSFTQARSLLDAKAMELHGIPFALAVYNKAGQSLAKGEVWSRHEAMKET